MNRTPLLPVLLISLVALLLGCDKTQPKKAPPPASSKDFWIDRCDVKYRGKEFPITGTIEDLAGLLGPFDRHEKLGDRYFWDSLGLMVTTLSQSTRVLEASVYFAREESSSEIGLKLSDRPQDRSDLAEIKAGFPQEFFKGEMVLEGAVIGPVIDFARVDEARALYLKEQTGADAHVQPIRQSWSPTRYAFERNCADGRHLGFIFTLISAEAPFRMEAFTVGSNKVKAPETSK